MVGADSAPDGNPPPGLQMTTLLLYQVTERDHPIHEGSTLMI